MMRAMSLGNRLQRGSAAAAGRWFSGSARLSSYRLVDPAVVFEDVEAGRAALVDLRATDDGINVPRSERVPFDQLVKRGGPGAEGVSRDALLAQLSEEQLDAAEYHGFGASLLQTMEQAYGKKFTAAQASQFFQEKAKDVQHPKKFAQRQPKGGRPAAQFDEQPTPTQNQLAGKKAGEFLRMAAYNPDVTKEELAANLSDAELAKRAGIAFTNLGGEDAVTLNKARAQEAVPKDRPVYLLDFCGVQSPLAAELLGQAGWSNVNVVDGGLDRWLMNGCEVELTGALAAGLESTLAASAKQAPGNLEAISD